MEEKAMLIYEAPVLTEFCLYTGGLVRGDSGLYQPDDPDRPDPFDPEL